MIYPWMFEDYAYLAPLREAAQILAEYEGWPPLYDLEKLAANTVPGAAAVYHDDMYVAREFSQAIGRHIPGLEMWITNAFQHNGLRAQGERVLDRLIRMRRGEA